MAKKKNIIVYLGTGSGKTFIAVMLIQVGDSVLTVIQVGVSVLTVIQVGDSVSFFIFPFQGFVFNLNI